MDQQQSGAININVNARCDPDEPPRKKIKLEQQSSSENATRQRDKLEYRLGGILCCVVCSDLPKTAIYQCENGHLMCAACFTNLLANGRMRDQCATCPNCRVEISKTTASRNIAVEKAASELPRECQYCGNEYPYKSLERHETIECQERPTNCKYSRIGCQWRGENHKTMEHESNCLHPKKSGYEIMTALEAYDANVLKELKIRHKLIDLLSYENITFIDLQLKPYQSDQYVLFYETSLFQAFNYYWTINARINNSEREPHKSIERTITYRLVLKTKMIAPPMNIHFVILKGPFSDMKVATQIYNHEFTEQCIESKYCMLPLTSSECNRLLSNKVIHVRLIMLLLDK